jgi:hypothetical protein
MWAAPAGFTGNGGDYFILKLTDRRMACEAFIFFGF